MIPRRLLVLSLAVLAVAASGCLRDVDAEPESRLAVEDVDVEATRVTTGRVALEVTPTLLNRGGPSGQVNVTVKAYDKATGLLLTTNRTTVASIPADATRSPSLGIEVPRKNGVRIEVELGPTQRIRKVARLTVSNLAGLSPTVHDTPLSIGTMDFVVREVTGSEANGTQRVRIETRIYLTNEGADASEPLRVQVKAREANTSLLGDENWTDVGSVVPGATRIVPVNLTVPDGHNYRVEVALWRDSFVLERGRDAVQLLPTSLREAGTELQVSDPNVRRFEDPPGGRGDDRPDDGGAPAGGAGVPGPGAMMVAAAAAGAALLVRRGGRRR